MNKITAPRKLSQIVKMYENDANVETLEMLSYRGIITTVRIRMKEGDVLLRVFTGPSFTEMVVFRNSDYTLEARRALMVNLYQYTHLTQAEVGKILGLSQPFINAELHKLNARYKCVNRRI